MSQAPEQQAAAVSAVHSAVPLSLQHDPPLQKEGPQQRSSAALQLRPTGVQHPRPTTQRSPGSHAVSQLRQWLAS